LPATLHSSDKQGILNKLLAPGPLIESHSKLEKADCLECHDAGKGVPNDKCLACHKELKASVEKKKTFHGQLANKNCIECHTDHKGRDFDSTNFNHKTFDHSKTGQPLSGKHKQIRCIECHKETREKFSVRKKEPRFLGLMANCTSCHKKDDVHLYQNDFAKKDCNECHNDIRWKDAKNFDHAKVSSFKLEGKHQEMKCAKCHTPEGDKKGPSIYKWPKLAEQNCLSCHANFHKNKYLRKYNDGKCENATSKQLGRSLHLITH